MKHSKSIRMTTGVFICLFGIQISRLLMEMFSIEKTITNLVFIVGLLLVIDISGITFTIKKHIIPVLLYQFLVLMYGFYSGRKLFDDIYGLIYTFFVIVFIFVLYTNDYEHFDSDSFINIGWWIMGIGSFILMWISTNGLKTFSTFQRLNQGSDRLTLSVIPFAFLVFALVKNNKSRIQIVCNVVFILCSLVDIVICTRKGMLISLIVIYILYYFEQVTLNKSYIIKFFGICGLVFGISWVIYTKVPVLNDLVNNFTTTFNNAILGYFGKASGQYNSGYMRNSNLSIALQKYNAEYSLVNYLFGKGYAYINIDMPILTAFMDLGIFGGISYMYLTVFMPIKIIYHKTSNVGLKFFQYYSIVVIFQNIYSGVSYGHYKFIPVICLLYAYYAALHTEKGRIL